MKIKLFRVFTLVFVLASVVNLAFVPTTHADALSDQTAIGLIVECKNKVGPFPPDSNCGKFTGCLTNAGKAGDDDTCKSVRAFNGAGVGITPISGATLTSCTKAGKKADECTSAYGNCVYFHIKSNKISSADTKTCTDLVAQGKLDEANKDPNAEKTSCVVQGIGWLICPVMTFLSKVVDGAYLVVSSLLTVQPLLTSTGADNSIYQAWSIMRNFANVAFVIAFLVIILSQVSSIGITNYGIKKLLPKLIVSAVLVNISYWLCAIAVDVSNILGTSLGGLFDSLGAKIGKPTGIYGTSLPGWEGTTVGVLEGTIAVGALLYVTISALLPALVVVLLAIVTVFLVLTLRQALIILLVVVAPLAFVAYLLPNTESMFKKWRELFQTLLLMFPIISLIFGASALASKIVMTSADGPYKIAIQIMGAMVAIIPLAITPIVMRTAGGVLNRFGGFINNPNKGPFDRLKKGAQGYADYRHDVNRRGRLKSGGNILKGEGGLLGDQYSRRRRTLASLRSKGATGSYIPFVDGVNEERKRAFAKGIADETAQGYFAERALGQEGFAKKMAGGDERLAAGMQASAEGAVKKIFDTDVANREILLRADVQFKNDPAAALKKAIQEGDSVTAVAAQNLMYASGSGGISKFRETVQNAESDPSVAAGYGAVEDSLKANIKERHGQYAKQKGADVVSWANSDSGTKLAETDYAGELSDHELAGQHGGSLQKMVDHGKISQAQAERVLDDPRVSANLDKGKRNILEGAAGRPPTP